MGCVNFRLGHDGLMEYQVDGVLVQFVSGLGSAYIQGAGCLSVCCNILPREHSWCSSEKSQFWGQIELLRLQVGPESGILNSGLALDGYRFRCGSRIELITRPFAKFTSSIQTPEHPAMLYYMQKFF